MKNSITITNIEAFTSSEQGGELASSHQLSNIFNYASTANCEIIITDITTRPFKKIIYESRDDDTLEITDINKLHITKFATPKYGLIIKNYRIKLSNLIYLLPQKVKFINCDFFIFNSYITKMVTADMLQNCSLDYQLLNNKIDLRPIPEEIRKINKKFLGE